MASRAVKGADKAVDTAKITNQITDGFSFNKRGWSMGRTGSSLENPSSHFSKHGTEVGTKTLQDYYDKANKFVDAKGTYSFTDPIFKNGEKIHYNPRTHEKVITDKGGNIKSYHIENRPDVQKIYNKSINK